MFVQKSKVVHWYLDQKLFEGSKAGPPELVNKIGTFIYKFKQPQNKPKMKYSSKAFSTILLMTLSIAVYSDFLFHVFILQEAKLTGAHCCSSI
jgi:hypothetical protein